jgi:hypothetical protein
MIRISDTMFKLGIALSALSLALLPMALSAKETQPVKVEKPESFKGVTQVVIGQFTVAYFTKKVDYDGGGFLAASAQGKAIGHLSGLTPADFQATTDAVYADFTKQLAAHGITVVDPAGLTGNQYYGKVKQEVQGETVDVVLKKQDHADAVAYWPTQLGRNDNALLQMRMMDMNMGRTYTAQYDYARTAKVPVLNVVYFVDFAKPATSSGGGLFQSIKVKAGLALSQFGSQMALMDTNGKMAKISLAVPIEEGGDFANITDTTSGVTKAVRVASILGGALGGLGGLGGGGRNGMSERFDYAVVDTAAYAEKTVSASTKATDLFLRQIEALR